jgi:hypothetical protein
MLLFFYQNVHKVEQTVSWDHFKVHRDHFKGQNIRKIIFFWNVLIFSQTVHKSNKSVGKPFEGSGRPF